MTFYDYKVIPAPRRLKRIKGIRDPNELFAHTLTDAINEIAREGWEYVRAESLTAEETRGLFRRRVEFSETVLVFRRPRETVSVPRLAAVRSAPPAEPDTEAQAAPEPAHPGRVTERPFADRLQGDVLRRDTPPVGRPEPRLNAGVETIATPLRPSPRLGPAERP
jgi:hypothetical protein